MNTHKELVLGKNLNHLRALTANLHSTPAFQPASYSLHCQRVHGILQLMADLHTMIYT